eukprot:3855952-Pleurochrysis_carterae.AAC.1
MSIAVAPSQPELRQVGARLQERLHGQRAKWLARNRDTRGSTLHNWTLRILLERAGRRGMRVRSLQREKGWTRCPKFVLFVLVLVSMALVITVVLWGRWSWWCCSCGVVVGGGGGGVFCGSNGVAGVGGEGGREEEMECERKRA